MANTCIPVAGMFPENKVYRDNSWLCRHDTETGLIIIIFIVNEFLKRSSGEFALEYFTAMMVLSVLQAMSGITEIDSVCYNI